MKVLVNRYYYSLAELAGIESGPGPIEGIGDFNSLLYSIQPFWAPATPETAEQVFFADYLWPEFYDAPVLFIDKAQEPWGETVEPTADDLEEATTHLVGRLHRWYKDSYGRYAVLLNELEGIKNKLMGPVNVVSQGSAQHSESSETSGSNSGTTDVSGVNKAAVTVNVSGKTTGTASSDGTSDSVGTDSRSHSMSSNSNHKESDTPQSALASITDGYISKASMDEANETGGESGKTVSSSTNNTVSSSSTENDTQTDTDSRGSNSSTTTNSQTNDMQVSSAGGSSTEGIVSNDMDTPIARFRELQDKLSNLYGLWADEFDRFVIHSAE